jgi:peptidoglycan/LPS O-acetylase OafA/YrhL
VIANMRWEGPARPFNFIIVPAFFALSGFLVAGSLERNNLPSFLTLRFIRIYPALVTEVLLSALILGPLLTTYPLARYFTDHHFWRYLVNITGHISYLLPGMFETNPAGPRVNSQLWTVPWELCCYVTIAALALLKVVKRPWMLMGVLTLASIALFARLLILHHVIRAEAPPPGMMIVLCFLFGVALYRLADRIPWTRAAFGVAQVAAWFTCLYPQAAYLAPLPIAYVTVWLGLLNPPRVAFMQFADYSYGLYLYGYPVQQTLVYLFPQYRIWWVNLIAAVVLTALFAAFSWHFIEKPVQDRKKQVLAWVNARFEPFQRRSAAREPERDLAA